MVRSGPFLRGTGAAGRWEDLSMGLMGHMIEMKRRTRISSSLALLLSLSLFLFFRSLLGVSEGRTFAGDDIFVTENDGFFHSFGVPDGLSQSTGQDILQDSFGRLWVGTQDGLDRHLGNGFRVYRRDDADARSLSDNVVMELYEDSRRTLWVGTFQGGLCRYDPATDSFDRFTTKTKGRALRSNGVRDIVENGKGELLVATEEGLDVLDRDRVRVRHVASTDGLRIQRLLPGADGNVWLGCSSGLVRLAPDGSTRLFLPPKPESTEVLSLARWEGGKILLVFGSSALFLFDPASGCFAPYPKRHPELRRAHYLTVCRSARGPLWIGTYDKGLFRDDGPGRPVLHFTRNPEFSGTLAGDAIRRLVEDRHGHLWIGTYFNGISVFAPERRKFHVVRHAPRDPFSLLDNMVRGFWFDEKRGELWVASLRGVSRWMPRRGYRRYSAEDGRFPASLSSRVRGMYRAPDGRLFVFCYGGLCIYDRREDRFLPYRPPGVPSGYRPERALALHLDRNGNEWIATETGVFRRDREERWFRYVHDPKDPRSLPSDYVSRFFEQRDGRVWVSSESAGAGIWTPGKEGFDRVSCRAGDPVSLGANNIFSFLETGDVIWLGTQGGGLSRMDKVTGKIRTFGRKEGLPNETIYAILPERETGRLWLATNNGVARFDPRSGAVRAFDETDGLQSREFNNYAYHKSPGGLLFLGGISGFNYFRPEETDLRTPARGVVVDRFLVEGVDRNGAWSLDSVGAIDLSWREKDIAIAYSPVDLTVGDRIEFMVRLEGYDPDWKRVGNRRVAEYTNLPDGDYVFRIRASNGSGEWDDRAASYRIHIGTPPWKTVPAYATFLLGGLLTLWMICRAAGWRQTKALRQAAEERGRLGALVRERTAELVRANEELVELASHDALTGLFNRRKFDEAISAEVLRADRNDRPISLVMGDIDHFKRLNDREGHLFGDRVLAAVGSILSSEVRETDVLARWGGEEFVLLMPETGIGEARTAAERLRAALAAVGERLGRGISMSFGVAERLSRESADDLLRRADNALRRAKREGRDRTVLAEGVGGGESGNVGGEEGA
jgi:diguanylate cyclase (GGDEF)-like protein